MSMDIHIEWDGQTKEERLAYFDNDRDWRDAWEGGYLGYLGGWHWANLFQEAVNASTSRHTYTAKELHMRIPATIQKLIEEWNDNFVDPYWEHNVNSLLGFVARYTILEAEGKNPRVWASW